MLAGCSLAQRRGTELEGCMPSRASIRVGPAWRHHRMRAAPCRRAACGLDKLDVLLEPRLHVNNIDVKYTHFMHLSEMRDCRGVGTCGPSHRPRPAASGATCTSSGGSSATIAIGFRGTGAILHRRTSSLLCGLPLFFGILFLFSPPFSSPFLVMPAVLSPAVLLLFAALLFARSFPLLVLFPIILGSCRARIGRRERSQLPRLCLPPRFQNAGGRVLCRQAVMV